MKIVGQLFLISESLCDSRPKVFVILAAALVVLFWGTKGSSHKISVVPDAKMQTFNFFKKEKIAKESTVQNLPNLSEQKDFVTAQNSAELVPSTPNPLSPAGRSQPPARIGTIKVSIGNLRSRPTLNSSIIYSLKSGDTVTFMKKKEEWYIIKLHDDRTGWAHQSLFLDNGRLSGFNKAVLEQRETENESKVTIMVNTGRVREKPSLDAKIKFMLKKSASVSVIETKDEWNLVELGDGRLGWAHQSLFSKSHQVQVPATPLKEIKEIEIILTPEGEEMVTFLLNGYYPPKTFSITENSPKVICDFVGFRLGKGIERYLKANGNLIQQIRIGIHKGSMSKVRVVLDLVPNQQYEIRPVFFKDENLFTLIVGKIR